MMGASSTFNRLYAVAVVAYLALFVAVAQAGRWRPWAIGLGLGCVLLPGRVQGWLLRDLFRGRRLLEAGDARAAASCFQRMLERLAVHPQLEWALWISCPPYTRSLRAMTLNDLGAAMDALEEQAHAMAYWQQALAADPRYPLPHVNLALAETAAGRPEAGEEHFRHARALGFSGNTLDAAIQRAQSPLAQVEGRGKPHRAST